MWKAVWAILAVALAVIWRAVCFVYLKALIPEPVANGANLGRGAAEALFKFVGAEPLMETRGSRILLIFQKLLELLWIAEFKGKPDRQGQIRSCGAG